MKSGDFISGIEPGILRLVAGIFTTPLRMHVSSLDPDGPLLRVSWCAFHQHFTHFISILLISSAFDSPPHQRPRWCITVVRTCHPVHIFMNGRSGTTSCSSCTSALGMVPRISCTPGLTHDTPIHISSTSLRTRDCDEIWRFNRGNRNRDSTLGSWYLYKSAANTCVKT